MNDYLELHVNVGGTKFTDVQELNYSLREVELRMWMLLYSCTGVAKQQGHLDGQLYNGEHTPAR